MGGLVCAIPHLAIMSNEVVPTDPASFPAYDAKLRKCFAQTDIVAGLVEKGHGDDACAILKKGHFTHTDRVTLTDMLDSLYDD